MKHFYPKYQRKTNTQKTASKSNSPDESHYVNDKIPPHQHTSSCSLVNHEDWKSKETLFAQEGELLLVQEGKIPANQLCQQ